MPAICKKKESLREKLTSRMDSAKRVRAARVQLNKILFASDFSPASDLALPFAAGLAKCFGATLCALNVREPINTALPPETWLNAEMTRKMKISALRESLDRECPEIVSQVIDAEGVVWREIENIVHKLNIDLVVIGTRGRHGVGRFLLGSQAEEILRHSTCPVYTVGPSVTGAERQRGQLRSIVFASDFGPASTAAAPYAVSLAEECAARLSLLHVIENGALSETPQGDNSYDACRRLEALLPDDAHLGCDPSYVIQHGEPSEKIVDVAFGKDADLIVLGVHPSDGIPGAATHVSGATVHKVITQAHCPVLTVPAPETDT